VNAPETRVREVNWLVRTDIPSDLKEEKRTKEDGEVGCLSTL
jgi:hypothetical protein